MDGQQHTDVGSIELPVVQGSSQGDDRVAVPIWSRRDFLTWTGFSFAAAVTGCQRTPVRHAVPYVNGIPGQTPGQAVWYAATCQACPAGCGVLVKNRDGRPIKLEGNPDHPVNRGGLCPVGQASILGLYDRQRITCPFVQGREATWEEVDRTVRERLAALRSRGKLRFLSSTIISPTERDIIDRFLSQFSDARHIEYDIGSYGRILDAHDLTHGVRRLPHYRFDRADVIVAVDADFLGTWLSPVEFAHAWSRRRSPDPGQSTMSLHVQIEPRFSVTGSKADQRLCLSPQEITLALRLLASQLASRRRFQLTIPDPTGLSDSLVQAIRDLSDRLWRHRSTSLVVCGTDRIEDQVLCNIINHLLDNYERTLSLQAPSYQSRSNDAGLKQLREELVGGEVDALIVYDCNPVFDLTDAELERAVGSTFVVDLAQRMDETASLADVVCPIPHWLEQWKDVEPVEGVAAISQPALHVFGQSRPMIESLTRWQGRTESAYTLIRDHWRREFFSRQTRDASFEQFWNKTVHDGYVELRRSRLTPAHFQENIHIPETTNEQPQPGTITLQIYPSHTLRDGRHAYNPWLHELPDPVTKITWDNCILLSPTKAEELDAHPGDILAIEAPDGTTVELPVWIQPGQHDEVAVSFLGYGGLVTERFSELGPRWLEARPCVGPNGRVGVNIAPLFSWDDNGLCWSGRAVRITKTGRQHSLACTQNHHRVEVPRHLAVDGEPARPMIRTFEIHEALSNRSGHADTHHHAADLWGEAFGGGEHHWGMVIDLNRCTGCAACVIACQVENNTPVVGKDEVRRQREMHWLRIDRYFEGEGDTIRAYHQPMLCHHCDNAPCETVCPVLATVHSEEGLNQQVYNRCVGTRYCANNCPYKVRRFNWFAYDHGTDRERLVLNPDVTVRTRGVMEKCTFCVQRIEEARAANAGRSGGPLSIETACQQSCPTGAISFGDLHQPDSDVTRQRRLPRAYQLLAEYNLKPAVWYLGIVHNRGT